MSRRRRRRPVAVAALALAALFAGAGCQPCHGWADLPVTDPDGLASSDQLAAVQAGIDQFVSWTQREETCVDEVRMVDALEKNEVPVAGWYQESTRRIELVVGNGLTGVVTHELCHALDHEEGWVSLDHADVLAPYAERLDPVVYDTPDARTTDAFARICAEGPYLPAFYQRIAEDCSLDLGDDAVAFVDEVAFPASTEETALGTFSAGATWAEIAATGRTGDGLGGAYVRGGADLYVLDHAGVLDEDGVDYQVQPELLRIDPTTRQVEERLALDAFAPTRLLGRPAYALHTLLGSSGDPILYSVVDGAAWRVHHAPLSLEPIALPGFDAETFVSGFEHDGRAFVRGRVAEADTIAIVDLGSGAMRPVAAGELDRFRADRPVELYADDLGAVAVFDGGTGLVLVGLDWDGEVEWTHALPGNAWRTRALARLADGTILVVPVVSTADDFGLAMPLRLDPVSGAWSAPVGECEGWSGQDTWVGVGEAPVAVGHQARGDGTYVLRWGELSVTE